MNFARDEVARAAPRGRDSIAQGASALGQASIECEKPQRGGIPSVMATPGSRWNPTPLGLTSRRLAQTQGFAALRPGLSNLAPSGLSLATSALFFHSS